MIKGGNEIALRPMVTGPGQDGIAAGHAALAGRCVSSRHAGQDAGLTACLFVCRPHVCGPQVQVQVQVHVQCMRRCHVAALPVGKGMGWRGMAGGLELAMLYACPLAGRYAGAY